MKIKYFQTGSSIPAKGTKLTVPSSLLMPKQVKQDNVNPVTPPAPKFTNAGSLYTGYGAGLVPSRKEGGIMKFALEGSALDLKVEQLLSDPDNIVQNLNSITDENELNYIIGKIKEKARTDSRANRALQILAQTAQQIKLQQAQMAEKGAKLQFIKSLRGICPEGEQLTYMLKGGVICPVCKKGAKAPENKREEFFKKEPKAPLAKCGKKVMAKCGCKTKKKVVTKNQVGGPLRYASSFIDPNMKGSVYKEPIVANITLPEVTITASKPFKRNFTVYGNEREGFNNFTFSGNTPFGRVTNEFMHPIYLRDNGNYGWYDFDDDEIGRYIMNGDTVYWSGKLRDESNGFGTGGNQDSLKNEFYKQLNDKGTTTLYKESDKKDLQRLRKESKKK